MTRRNGFGFRTSSLLGTLLLVSASACGVLTQQRTIFPEAVEGADGTYITQDELLSVLDNDDLDDDEKRQALRDLGLEDERFIDILVG